MDIENILQNIDGIAALERTLPFFTFLSRFILPILALVILLRCLQSLLRERIEPEVWGYLSLPNATRVALCHWENLIGRTKTADVSLNYPTISRSHLALTRDDKARWTATDLGSKAGVTINGSKLNGKAEVRKGDVLGLGGVEVALLDLNPAELGAQSMARTKPGLWFRPSGTFFFLTLFIAVLAVQHSIVNIDTLDNFNMQIPLGFAALAAIMWGYFFIVRAMGRTGFEVEAMAFFLCSVSMSVIATAAPHEMLRTAGMILGGVIFFIVICFILRDLGRAKLWRWPIGIAGILLLAAGFVLAEELYGARRWIEIGGFRFQPSEFVKIAFIFVGAASLERLFARRNLFSFIGYAAVCVGMLALQPDFGSAAVFFATFLVIAFLRSGDWTTISLALASVVFAGFLVLTMAPHVAARFANWGNIWEYPNWFSGGMQQVRTLSSTASGGLFGLGAGEGVLHSVFAADADMVFGVVAEELGLLIAIMCVVIIILFGVLAIRSTTTARSSFYVIAAGAAVTMFLAQTILNVFGALDIIPFTGITFPFVSRGGSSMLASWGMLAFIKAADTRQNASLAVKLDRKAIREAKLEEYYDEYDDVGTYDDIHDDHYEEDRRGEPLDGGIDPLYFNDNTQDFNIDSSTWDFSDGWEDRL
ncbi:MAG: FtsW/RodA/SpoVE family cell cycle protein [Oscillospiraceae bacterium]|nr:FtsW/RodA/SpoVE family cell cycle protein [Oscillospiraceae bacterium]